MNTRNMILILGIVGIVFLFGITNSLQNTNKFDQITINQEEFKVIDDDYEDVATFDFEAEGLKTNTAKSSINLTRILDGGPGKDGIPSINYPKFLTIQKASGEVGLNDETRGIQVVVGDDARFYPFGILYWHEIVNDTIGGKKVAITFCPLCGTAIVYNRIVNGVELTFGVSGKLYESNLLMYDDKTHSLWSQSIGEATVGDYVGTELEVLTSNLITYEKYKKNHPSGLVLSEDTGFFRNYSRTPYGSYETDASLFFPVENEDLRVHSKELLFVLPYNGDSYAFVRADLQEVGTLEFPIGEDIVTITYDEGIITAQMGEDELPGYIEMFFSCATWHKNSENLWMSQTQLLDDSNPIIRRLKNKVNIYFVFFSFSI